MSWCFYLFLSSVLRQPFSLFTACSTGHCGTSACCLRWRWEGSLLCLRVGFSFLCGSAGGWAESLSCYFLTSFATSFGRRSRSHWWTESSKAKRVSKAKKVSGPKRQYFSTPETWTVECNCRRIFANIWFSQVWKHSSYTYAIPWCFKIWAWLRLRHEFLETAIPWWFTSKFWPRHELGMSLSFDCSGWTWLCDGLCKIRRGVHQTIMGIPPSEPMLRTDNVVCPDCNMEDAWFCHTLIG